MNNADFIFDLIRDKPCECELNDSETSFNLFDKADTSSSENEEDYFSYIIPSITDEELKGFTLQLENPLKCLKPVLNFLDDRMIKNILSYIDPKNFFVDHKEKKIHFLISLPNSYYPLYKKPAEAKDVICAPSYLTEKEEEFYVRPFFLQNGRFTFTNRGLTIKLNLTDKTDEQSNYVFYQGKFYESIVKDRFVNGNKNSDEEQEREYDFPITIYEPVSFLKRFCEVFYYLNISFTEICGKKLNEETMIKKFSTGLFLGFHKVLASQGMPLPSLIGETYVVTDVTGNFELFAEVKNDKPITICYNIRWKKREALIDGLVEFGFNYDETLDEFVIKISGTNKLRILNSEKTYTTFYFNFPLSASILSVVDQSKFKDERSMTINGLMYIKGETFCAIFNFNFLKLLDFSSKLVGFIKKSIINLNTLVNGHSFIALLFHSSSFSFPRKIKNSEILNEMFIKKKVVRKKTMMTPSVDKKDQSPNEGNKDNTNNSEKGQSSALNAQKDGNSKESLEKDKENEIKEGKESDSQKSPDKMFYNINKPQKIKIALFKDKVNRINRNPNSYFNRIFWKVVEVTNMLIEKSEFVTSFSEGFIDKMLIGSWVRMNFFEVNLNNNDELSEYYLQFDQDIMKAKSNSKYNRKNGIFLPWDNFEFLKTLKKIYREDNWQYVKNPLPTDTRFREDYLWLLRFFQIMGKYEGYADKYQEELENLKIEAIINSGKWKDLLDIYVYNNISKVINNIKPSTPGNNSKKK